MNDEKLIKQVINTSTHPHNGFTVTSNDTNSIYKFTM